MGSTATVHRPPTEAEIREHLQRAFADRPSMESESDRYARHGAVAWFDTWTELATVTRALWDVHELSTTEDASFDELLFEPLARLREQVEPQMLEILVKGGIAFAAEHPDAPRRKISG